MWQIAYKVFLYVNLNMARPVHIWTSKYSHNSAWTNSWNIVLTYDFFENLVEKE